MQLTPVEARVLDNIDETALVQNLIDLIRVPSVTGSDEESELQNAQAAQLREAGMSVDAWKFDLEALQNDPRFPGIEVPRAEGYGVVGVTGPGRPALVLQGHVDVVPTGDLDRWHDGDPFSGRVDAGAVHGRGACDMKAGVAANLAVVRALQTSGVILERPIAVHTVVGEEDGGLGAFGTMLRGHTGDVAVLTEPTSGRIVTACAGALTFELNVTGRAAHGSTRLEGVSAFDAFLPVMAAISSLEKRRNLNPHQLFIDYPLPYPISIGTVHAGDWASSVPDLLVAEGRLGVQLGEDPAQARSEFETVVAEACAADPWLRDHPVAVTWPGGQFASGQIDSDHSFIDEVAAAIMTLNGGAAPDRRAAPYGSDLRLYSDIGGIPSLHYGPGDVRFAHAPREQVLIDELITVTRSLALLAVRKTDAHL
ncbi:MAG: ArgE/DapE family deacylase [Microbacteriaceae bacterium]